MHTAALCRQVLPQLPRALAALRAGPVSGATLGAAVAVLFSIATWCTASDDRCRVNEVLQSKQDQNSTLAGIPSRNDTIATPYKTGYDFSPTTKNKIINYI